MRLNLADSAQFMHPHATLTSRIILINMSKDTVVL